MQIFRSPLQLLQCVLQFFHNICEATKTRSATFLKISLLYYSAYCQNRTKFLIQFQFDWKLPT